MSTMQLTAKYNTVDCPRNGCHVVFAISEEFEARKRADHKDFYCPNGHPMAFGGDTEEEKLRKELARTRKTLEAQVEYANQQQRRVSTLDRRLSAAKGQLTKMRNRIANGVCPAPGCKRSGLGADVMAHIATCHPEFVVPSAAGSVEPEAAAALVDPT